MSVRIVTRLRRIPSAPGSCATSRTAYGHSSCKPAPFSSARRAGLPQDRSGTCPGDGALCGTARNHPRMPFGEVRQRAPEEPRDLRVDLDGGALVGIGEGSTRATSSRTVYSKVCAAPQSASVLVLQVAKHTHGAGGLSLAYPPSVIRLQPDCWSRWARAALRDFRTLRVRPWGVGPALGGAPRTDEADHERAAWRA